MSINTAPLARIGPSIIKLLVGGVIGCLPHFGVTRAAEPSRAFAELDFPPIRVVRATDSLIRKASRRDELLSRLLSAAKPTIGVPYRWGGTRLHEAIDCSNYTWQLYRAVGIRYDRFISTMALSRLKQAHGLRRVSFQDAGVGDLLVYGYRDQTGKWRGHVVILVDKDGTATGHKGLVLGAHGGNIGEVQFITFAGFEEGFFQNPRMRLCNILRVEGLTSRVPDATKSCRNVLESRAPGDAIFADRTVNSLRDRRDG